MPRVNTADRDTACLSFVRDQRVQASKTPPVPPLLVHGLGLLATPGPGGLSHVLEVLKGNGCPVRVIVHNAFGEDDIVIGASPKLFPRSTRHVTLCRFEERFFPPRVCKQGEERSGGCDEHRARENSRSS